MTCAGSEPRLGPRPRPPSTAGAGSRLLASAPPLPWFIRETGDEVRRATAQLAERPASAGGLQSIGSCLVEAPGWTFPAQAMTRQVLTEAWPAGACRRFLARPVLALPLKN